MSRAGGCLRTALHAEWTKLRTTVGPAWVVLAVAVVTVAGSAATAAGVSLQPGARQDPTKLSLTGIQIGQAVVAVLAVMIIGNEHSSGMIRTTLTAMPRPSTVIAAKAMVLAGAVVVAGTVSALASVLAGQALLPRGFASAAGAPPVALTEGATLRAVVGSVAYLVLVALLGLGIATIVREPAAAIGVVLGALYVPAILAQTFGDPDWRRHLRQVAPMDAGLAIQATTDLRALPISPWAGLGVLAAWAGASVLAGALVLGRRDP